jgi:light-harvesting protein B-800-850 alpha chain
MNQARIWTVVKPTVGLPLFLGAVATTALLVHYAILTHTTWFSAYWNGHAHAAPATAAAAPAAAAPASTTP